MTPLRATVRLQLHADFDFDAVLAQLDYFATLGISHLYLSPIAEAVAGSTHGYDGVDPTRISSALGGEEGFVRLAEAVRRHGMGIILDIVPNHLATDLANPWWRDVLAKGQDSRYARWFDIDWQAPGAEGRVWLPVLAEPLNALLRRDALGIVLQDDSPWLQVDGGACWPLHADSVPAERETWPQWQQASNTDPAVLAAVLERQAYRLAWWRTGADRVNYRRFFDISGLVAMRVEMAEVFDAMHALPLRLVEAGWVDGLRIDHIDGLADPQAYLQRLRAALDAAGARRGLAAGALSLHVEKILAADEQLDPVWCCDGTTGYDFMDQVSAVFHDAQGQAALDGRWQQASAGARAFDELQRQARAQMLGGSLQADMDRCLRAVVARAVFDADCSELGPRVFERALRALLVAYPVYRTYRMQRVAEQTWLARAAGAAAEGLDTTAVVALEKLTGWLADASDPRNRLLRTRVAQLSAPLNAKAVEDTGFYRDARLLSRNEVGSDPAVFSLSPEQFLQRAQERARHWPRAMLALATHDHKRGPEARMRLAVLSAWPQAWIEAVADWTQLSQELGQPLPLPDAEAYTTWQALLAAWPLQPDPAEAADAADEAFAERMQQWLRKALREGKRVSSWSEPDEVLEASANTWLHWLCTATGSTPLRQRIATFTAPVARGASRLGLAQLALQLVCPGVPDLYQGGEGWDTSLVDPDNRRPVNYTLRRNWLQDGRPWNVLLQQWQDGAPKARLLATLLELRRQQPDLFLDGSLSILQVDPAHVLALARRARGRTLLLLVNLRPRALTGRINDSLRDGGQGDGGRIKLGGLPRGTYRSVLDERTWHNHGQETEELTALLAGGPLAVMVADTEKYDG